MLLNMALIVMYCLVIALYLILMSPWKIKGVVICVRDNAKVIYCRYLLLIFSITPRCWVDACCSLSALTLNDLWWRHRMETFSALLAICAGNSPIAGEFPAQRPVTQSFAAFFDLRLNKRLSKQTFGWWLETPSHPLWRHCNVTHFVDMQVLDTRGYFC